MNQISMINKVCLIVLTLVSVIYAKGKGQSLEKNLNSAAVICPTNWVTYNNHCYFVNTNTLPQPDAEAACTVLDPNAKLMVIDDQAEFNFWQQKIEVDDLGLLGPISFLWVGARRTDSDGPFQWNTGGILAANDPNWRSLYPLSINDTCVYLFSQNGSGRSQYQNQDCNLKGGLRAIPSICEKVAQQNNEDSSEEQNSQDSSEEQNSQDSKERKKKRKQ